MNSILEALYRGELDPVEAIVPSHPKYRSLSRQISVQTEQWRNQLGEETFRKLEEYFDLRSSVDSIYAEATFQYGFRLGANLMIEVIGKR